MQSSQWPWWIVPWYLAMGFVHFVTWPIMVMPFSLTCHRDLWGNEPPYSCTSWYCAKIAKERPDLWLGWESRCGPLDNWLDK